MTVFHASTAPERPGLGDDDLHVWSARLDVTASQAMYCWSALDDQERSRAERLRLAEHRRRFVAARGLLRVTLAGYLALPPAEVRFRYAPGGRPELQTAGAPQGLRFNVTHSGEVALFAVTRVRAVGVDIECVRNTDVQIETIAAQFFSLGERELLCGLPVGARRRGMWRSWTRQEAYWKAHGDGLSRMLRGSSVSRGPSGETGPDDAWSILDLPLGSDYVGAVAVQGPAPRLRLLTYVRSKGPQ